MIRNKEDIIYGRNEAIYKATGEWDDDRARAEVDSIRCLNGKLMESYDDVEVFYVDEENDHDERIIPLNEAGKLLDYFKVMDFFKTEGGVTHGIDFFTQVLDDIEDCYRTWSKIDVTREQMKTRLFAFVRDNAECLNSYLEWLFWKEEKWTI